LHATAVAGLASLAASALVIASRDRGPAATTPTSEVLEAADGTEALRLVEAHAGAIDLPTSACPA
jgi:hypothetical protein